MGYRIHPGSVGSFGYLILNFTRIAQTGGRINNMEIGIALVGIVCVFEAARRASGNLAILAALFLAYNWFGAYLPGYLGHNGFTLKRVLITQFWGTEGVLAQASAFLRRIFFSSLSLALS